MNNLNIDESGIVALKDMYGSRANRLKERHTYSCDIPFIRYRQEKDEFEIIWRLWKENDEEKEYYVLSKMKADSEEFNRLLGDVYPTHHDIFAVNLKDFLRFEGYCEVKFVNGYPKVIICDLIQTPVSNLSLALYGRGFDL